MFTGQLLQELAFLLLSVKVQILPTLNQEEKGGETCKHQGHLEWRDLELIESKGSENILKLAHRLEFKDPRDIYDVVEQKCHQEYWQIGTHRLCEESLHALEDGAVHNPGQHNP